MTSVLLGSKSATPTWLPCKQVHKQTQLWQWAGTGPARKGKGGTSTGKETWVGEGEDGVRLYRG